MALLAASPVFVLLLKTLALLACAVVGVRLLWSAHVDRTPRLAARREAKAKPYVSPYSKPLPAQPVATRLAPGSELQKLSTVLDHARGQLQNVHTATAAAARQIDGAEVALSRLLQDIAGVMPQAIATTIVPRRALSLAATDRAALAA
jgi:hypothetical protein